MYAVMTLTGAQRTSRRNAESVDPDPERSYPNRALDFGLVSSGFSIRMK
jgi:hypothetical protein